MGKAHWEYYQLEGGEWMSRFVSNNGRILFMSSEAYQNQADMLHALDILEDETLALANADPNLHLERRHVEG